MKMKIDQEKLKELLIGRYKIILVSGIRPVLQYQHFKSFEIVYQRQKKLGLNSDDYMRTHFPNYRWEITVEVHGDVDEFESIIKDNYQIILLELVSEIEK